MKTEGTQQRDSLVRRLADEAALDALDTDALFSLADQCEEHGFVRGAIEIHRRVLKRDEDNPRALEHLAVLLDEMGDRAGAFSMKMKLHGLQGEGDERQAPGEITDDAPPGDAHSAADLDRFCELFAGREGVHARQWADRQRGKSGYAPVRESLSPVLAHAHLQGRLTLGSYLVRTDDTSRHIVLDLDVRKDALVACSGDAARTNAVKAALVEEGRRLCGVLGQLGIPSLYVDSGRKGRHLWIVFTHPVPAAEAQGLGRELVRTAAPQHEDLHLEAFPKQGSVARGGLGNLVKLPLGIHRVSGRRSTILLPDGSVHARPMRALSRLARLEPGRLPALLDTLTSRPSRPTDIRDARSEVQSRAAEPPPPPPFQEKDLRGDPEIGALLEGCAVLQRAVSRILAEGRIDFDMIVALRHTIGHLGQGPRAVNFLLDRCEGTPADARMGRVNRGSPSSCANLRRRLAGIARRVGCDCHFSPRRDRSWYETPLLHVTDRDEAVRVLSTGDGDASGSVGRR